MLQSGTLYPAMSLFTFILSSARHYWRGHLGLVLGAFFASAILSGSLLVGDSVRASLRRNVRRMLAKYGYPPDLAEGATQLVLKQAELSTENAA